MSSTHGRSLYTSLLPFRAIFAAGAMALFLGALLSDVTYYRSEEVQWTNFAQWLLAGGLVFAAVPLLYALLGLSGGRRRSGAGRYLVVALATWLLGFIDSLYHARDGFASMPAGLWCSLLVFILSCALVWLDHALREGGAP